MLTSVFTKSVRDRWRGVTIAVVSLAALLYFGMVVYQDIDLSFFSDLGPTFEALAGIGPDADAASLAYNAIYGNYGAIIMAGLAIAMGADYIAGEERKGTIGVLLANPRSRTQVLVAKAAAMVMLLVLGGLGLWAAGVATPAVLDVSISGMDVGAFLVHLTAVTLFFGFLALAVGSWMGKSGVAAGVGAGVLALSFFAVGVLELIEGWEGLAKLFPWYYFTGSDPLLNGIDWGHIAILIGASALLFVVALVGYNRRDLRSRSTGVSLLDQLRSHPMTAKLGERLAGSARVSSIAMKTASEHQGLLFVVSTLMFLAMGLMMGPIYTFVEGSMAAYGDALPEQLLALFGGGDLSTPAGFYQIETFGMVAPIALMVVTITIAAKALAGEEENRTMGLLLANPVSRRTVVAQKAITMVVFGAIVGLATFAGTALGVVIAGVDLNLMNLAATCVLATLIGLLFGSLSLVIGAATGRVALAIFIPVGAALLFHTMNALASLSDAWWGTLSPFHYYLGNDPLNNGMDWGGAAVLTLLTVVLIALAFPAFDRAELREHA